MPYWQAFTPAPTASCLAECLDPRTGLIYSCPSIYGGGTFTGASLTPDHLSLGLQAHGASLPGSRAPAD